MADINGPAEIVKDKYLRSIALADAASAATNSLQESLNNSIYVPPTVNVQWQSLSAPNLPPIPSMPALPSVSFSEPPDQPGPFTATLNEALIDADFDVAAPVMNFGQAPVLTIGQAPVLPEVRDVVLPDAPNVVLPDAPQFLQLITHTFGGVNLHEDWLDKLDDIPELSVLQPAPFQYSPGAKYASELLANLKATLNARIHGGTGLMPAVEQAIWDRARDRETQVALAREQEVLRSAESLGFALPSGVMIGQLADARREYNDKLSSLSRDVAIKQADLEQQNVKDSIQFALQLETSLLDDAYKIEMLAFEATKTTAENAILIHNAALEHFKALLGGYQAYSAAYETVIKAELNKVEVFKAMLQSEQTKADINRSLVERYKAEIDGSMASVEIYKARVGAAKTLVELEGTRIQAGAEQVRAFVATVNAETAKADLYKVTIGAEASKQDAYKSQVQAYGAKVTAQSERARIAVASYEAKLKGKELEWDGWKARLSAATARVDAAARQSGMIVDGYRMGASAAEAQAGSYMRRWEADIRQYEAVKTITLQSTKLNADAVMHTNDARMDAAKVGLAASTQRLASAWAMVSASAQISGQSQTTQKLPDRK